ncbi:MAG: glycosyltransferase family 2 protein [Thermoanaerobaculia bacterium]
MSESARKFAPDLSIIVPAYNEAENLAILVSEIRKALTWADSTYEIILVDDASTDASPGVMRRLAEANQYLRVIRHDCNLGQSAALVAGFERARGAIVITLDADLQNDPGDIPRLLEELDDCDVVCGIRTERQDSWVRKVSSRIANGARNWMTSESIADVGCSLRAYRAEFLRGLPAFDGMHRFLPTLLRLNGARVREIPVNHRPRRFGTSKYGVNDRLWRGISDLFGVRWLQRRWIDRSAAREIRTDEAANGGDAPPAQTASTAATHSDRT